MKSLLPFLIFLLGITAGLPAQDSAAAPAIPPLEQKFRDGLYAEEAKQDFHAAARAYQEVVAAYDRDRETAASALFRLGEVHRKQNRTDEAVACFRRVAREFPDREPLARLAKENLKALGQPLPDVPGAATPAPGADPEQDKALARLQELAKNSPDLILNPQTGLKANGCISYDEAIQSGYLRIVTWLLEYGASPDKTPFGQSPLALAAQNGHRALIELLLSKNADINGTEDFECPLAAAARRGHRAIAELLLEKGADVNGREKRQVPLIAAAEAGHKSVMELLLGHGADPNAESGKALIATVRAGKEDLVKLLLEKKADPNKARTRLNRQGTSPPGFMLEVIVKPASGLWGYKGYATGSIPYDVFTPLHLATLTGQETILTLLIAHGADVNAKSEAGSTPLELACVLDRMAIATLLAKAGAKGDHIAPGDMRLVDIAALRHNLPLYVLLREAGARVDGPASVRTLKALTSWSDGKDDLVAFFKRLINDGAAVDGDASFSPLAWAGGHGDVELIQLLKAKGADFTPVAVVPPLAAAVESWFTAERFPVLQALLDGGADLNARITATPATSHSLDGMSAYQIVCARLPEVSLLESFLAFKPQPEPEAFEGGFREYIAAQSSLNPVPPGNPPGKPVIVTGSSSRLHFHTDSKSQELAVKNGPDTLRRIWDYEKLEQNKDRPKHVWFQSFSLDAATNPPQLTNWSKRRFVAAGPAGQSLNVAEVLAAVFNHEWSQPKPGVPDFKQLTILRCDAAGKITMREPLDLLALAGNDAAVALPVLQPGDVLDTIPTDAQAGYWRDFPDPVPALMAKVLTRRVTVNAGDWTRAFKVVPPQDGFRWDPSTDLLAVPNTLTSVIRFLPKPPFFYRMEAVQVTQKGREPVTLDLTKPIAPDKDIMLGEGDEISVAALPEDDTGLLARRRQGIFISCPEDGFLREVYRDPAAEEHSWCSPGMDWHSWLFEDVIRTFYLESECVLPHVDMTKLTFHPAKLPDKMAGYPWGGELEVRRLKGRDDTSWTGPADRKNPGASLLGGYALDLNITVRGRNQEKANFVWAGGGFQSTPNGWIFVRSIQPGLTSRTLPALVRSLTAAGKARSEWELHESERKTESLLARFKPDTEPPALFLRDGYSLVIGPEDEGLVNRLQTLPVPPPRVRRAATPAPSATPQPGPSQVPVPTPIPNPPPKPER